MKTSKTLKDIQNKLDSIFDIEDDAEKLEFEEMIINSDVMQVIQELMENSNEIKNRSQLATKLGFTEAYLSKLFSSDKYFNVNLLAKIQRIFNMRFRIMDSRRVPASTLVVVKLTKPYVEECEVKPSPLVAVSKESKSIKTYSCDLN